jgi:hypothetical protein
MVCVIKSMEVPKKTKVRRTFQKNRVPRIEMEKMAIASAWCGDIPMLWLQKNKLKEISGMRINFFSNFPGPLKEKS